jgi:carboxymethylenebutenolidase
MREHADALGFRAWPEGAPVPGVVMIPDVWGLADHTRDLARRLAGEGFAVLAIDPYRKTGAPRLSDVASALAWIRELSDPLVLETIQEAIDALAGHEAVAGRKLGVTGFCMGGLLTYRTAVRNDGFSAAAGFYGAGIARELAQPRCATQLFFGGQDPYISRADIDAVVARHPDTVVYEPADHGFMRDGSDSYHGESATDAWERLLAFFGQHLTV